MSIHRSLAPPRLGDDQEAKPTTSIIDEPAVRTVSGAAGIYHGYKRTGSVLWALLYGGIMRVSPVVGWPIALAQGFGKKKGT